MGRCLPLALALAACASLSPAQSVTVSPSTIPGVELIPPQNPDYWATVEQLFGATRSGTLNSWLPYGTVLKNGSSQTIVALAIRWERTTAEGQTFRRTLMSGPSAGSRGLVSIASSVVAIPKPMVLRSLDQHLEFQLTPPPGYVSHPDRSLTECQTARGIQTNLDGVVFASGQFVGPDTGQEYEYFEHVVAAPPQVASKVLAMQAAGEPVANVLAWLQTTASDRSTEMTRMMGNTAQELLRAYKIRGEQTMYNAAQTESQPVIQLHR